MDVAVLIFYLVFGAMVKLLTIQHPTPGRQYAAGFEVILGALAAGHLTHLFLYHWELIADSYIAMVFISIPLVILAIGRWITSPLDRARIWYKHRTGH